MIDRHCSINSDLNLTSWHINAPSRSLRLEPWVYKCEFSSVIRGIRPTNREMVRVLTVAVQFLQIFVIYLFSIHKLVRASQPCNLHFQGRFYNLFNLFFNLFVFIEVSQRDPLFFLEDLISKFTFGFPKMATPPSFWRPNL